MWLLLLSRALSPFLQTKGLYDYSSKHFESYSDFSAYSSKERRSKISFGLAIPGVAEFGFNYSSDKYSKSVKKLRRVSGKVTLFLFLTLYLLL